MRRRFGRMGKRSAPLSCGQVAFDLIDTGKRAAKGSDGSEGSQGSEGGRDQV